MSGARFPPELVLATLHNLRFDKETLQETCLVSKLWLNLSQPHLFARVYISLSPSGGHDSERTSCASLYGVLRGSPHIAEFIRHLGLGGFWARTDPTLPRLLETLSKARVETLQIRFTRSIPLSNSVETSLRALLNSPTMRNVDLTNFLNLTDLLSLVNDCPTLRKLKLSEGYLIYAVNPQLKDPRDAECESLTILDFNSDALEAILDWSMRSSSFQKLREARLAFDPEKDMALIRRMVTHVADTLESLHLQPVHGLLTWPEQAHFMSITGLPNLSSLRLSLQPSQTDKSIAWVVFLLETVGPNHLTELTIDLRLDRTPNIGTLAQEAILAMPWANLDSTVNEPHLSGLCSITITYFEERDKRDMVDWFRSELPRLLPRSWARNIFQAYELELEPSHFFYWPGSLGWSE